MPARQDPADTPAARAALATPRSTDPAGQTGRLKTIKRNLGGRAWFAPLRGRVLNAA